MFKGIFPSFSQLKRLAAVGACSLLATTASATIAGKVFCDTNGNGIYDLGEAGIPGVTVRVCDLSDITDANGDYSFSGAVLEAAVCDPRPYPFVVTVDVTSVTGDCTEPACPTSVNVMMTPAYDVNFCFRPPPPPPPTGCIGDFVWRDLNDNGQQDAGEPGIAGVSVTLLDANGNVVAVDITDANGFYLFENLVLGQYTVEVATPTGLIAASSYAPGVPENLDSNESGALVLIDANVPCDYTVDFGFIQPRPTNPGTGTPGFWKNHPDAWPYDEIEIGGVVYSKAQAITFMKKPTAGDKTFNMFEQLVSAILNVGIGNDDSCIANVISDANDWMAENPVGSGVSAESAEWAEGSPLHTTLDQYNNGLLCAPARD